MVFQREIYRGKCKAIFTSDMQGKHPVVKYINNNNNSQVTVLTTSNISAIFMHNV